MLFSLPIILCFSSVFKSGGRWGLCLTAGINTLCLDGMTFSSSSPSSEVMPALRQGKPTNNETFSDMVKSFATQGSCNKPMFFYPDKISLAGKLSEQIKFRLSDMIQLVYWFTNAFGPPTTLFFGAPSNLE